MAAVTDDLDAEQLAYERAYADGVEQERASIAKELARLDDDERLAWVRGFVRGYRLVTGVTL